MAFLQPVPNTNGGWITTFPFSERPGHVGFGSYGVGGLRFMMDNHRSRTLVDSGLINLLGGERCVKCQLTVLLNYLSAEAVLGCTQHPSRYEYVPVSVHGVEHVGLITCPIGIQRTPHAQDGYAGRGIGRIWARRVWSSGR